MLKRLIFLLISSFILSIFLNVVFFRVPDGYISPEIAVSHSPFNDYKKTIKTIWLGEEPVIIYEDERDLVWEAYFQKETVNNVIMWRMNKTGLIYDPTGMQVGGIKSDLGDKNNLQILYTGVVDSDKQLKVDGELPNMIKINLLGKDNILWFVIKNREDPEPIISY